MVQGASAGAVVPEAEASSLSGGAVAGIVVGVVSSSAVALSVLALYVREREIIML